MAWAWNKATNCFMTLYLPNNISLQDEELEITAIRAQGAGGQNGNKVSTAIHLRFDVPKSSLPGFYKERLLAYKDQRISKDGVIIIKAQRFRSQEKNKQDAVARLQGLIQQATTVQKSRRPTKPSRASRKKRVDRKTQRGKTKALRRSPVE